MNKFLRRFFVFIVLSIVLFTACSQKQEQVTQDSVKLPSFTAQIFEKEDKLESKDLEGLSLLIFVSDFCGPCHLEIKRMAELEKEYSKLSLYLGFVGKSERSMKICDSLGLSATKFVADSVLVRDLNIRSIPLRILVKDNVEIMRIVGGSSARDKEMTLTIDDMLGIVRDTTKTEDK